MKVNNKVLEEYGVIKRALADLKKQEGEMRIKILESLFNTDEVGTVNAVVGNYAVKGAFKNNYKLSQVDVEERWDAMTREEQDCINHKPTLVMKVYNATELTPVLDDCITVSPAMPTLVVKELPDE